MLPDRLRFVEHLEPFQERLNYVVQRMCFVALNENKPGRGSRAFVTRCQAASRGDQLAGRNPRVARPSFQGKKRRLGFLANFESLGRGRGSDRVWEGFVEDQIQPHGRATTCAVAGNIDEATPDRQTLVQAAADDAAAYMMGFHEVVVYELADILIVDITLDKAYRTVDQDVEHRLQFIWNADRPAGVVEGF